MAFNGFLGPSVVQIMESGSFQGICLIYNFNPKNEHGDRASRVDHNGWGYLSCETEFPRFSIARIAQSVDELDYGAHFS